MKTFKHRKTGEIATYKDGCFKQGNCVVEIGVEPSSEFWEEVIERDFEILKFTKGVNIYNVLLDGHLLVDIPAYKDIQYNPGAPHWTQAVEYGYKIYSVKRLSDGEVFTVGDKCINDTIKEFILFNNTRLYVTSENRTWGLDIKHLRKNKQKLFTTEDGVDIFEEDEYWCVWGGYCIKGRAIKEQIKDYFQESTKFFSTKEAGEKYILFNKPCLSIKEICPIIGQCNETTHIDLNKLTSKLENLVKSKTL